MSIQRLEQGVAAIQQGWLDEGAQLIRDALQSGQIQGPLLATAYLWLAETMPDPQEKLNCYHQAAAADPNNAQAGTWYPNFEDADLADLVNTRLKNSKNNMWIVFGCGSDEGYEINHLAIPDNTAGFCAESGDELYFENRGIHVLVSPPSA